MKRTPTALVLLLISYGAAYTEEVVASPKEISQANLWGLRLRELLPKDAAEYVEAVGACAHWGGEEPYDKDRAREIARKSKADCSRADALKKAIDARYHEGSDLRTKLNLVLKDVEDARDDFVWNDPEKKSRLLNQYYEGQAVIVVDAISRSLANNKLYYLRLQQQRIEPILKNIDRLKPATRQSVRTAADRLKAALEQARSSQ
jgi:hypothetical protein